MLKQYQSGWAEDPVQRVRRCLFGNRRQLGLGPCPPLLLLVLTRRQEVNKAGVQILLLIPIQQIHLPLYPRKLSQHIVPGLQYRRAVESHQLIRIHGIPRDMPPMPILSLRRTLQPQNINILDLFGVESFPVAPLQPLQLLPLHTQSLLHHLL